MARPSAITPNFGFQVFVGSAWMNPVTNRRAPRLGATNAPALTEKLYYASGAGNLMLMVVPERELVILRVGKESPAWRDQAIPNLLLARPRSATAGTWDWVYPWRIALRAGPPPAGLDPRAQSAELLARRARRRASRQVIAASLDAMPRGRAPRAAARAAEGERQSLVHGLARRGDRGRVVCRRTSRPTCGSNQRRCTSRCSRSRSARRSPAATSDRSRSPSVPGSTNGAAIRAAQSRSSSC